jgi:uncharacterized secreted protein with C-terminal beta-propeller domain
MRNTVGLVCLIAVFGLAGCGGGGGGDQDLTPIGDAPVDTSGLLRKIRNAAELEASIKAGVKGPSDNLFSGVPPAPAPADGNIVIAGLTPGNFSGTYTQELAVDELDKVRYDGEHIYIAPERYTYCCWIMPAANLVPGPPIPEPKPTSIRILRTDPLTATAAPVGEIPLAAGVSVQGLYIKDDRAVALTTKDFWGEFGNFWGQVTRWNSTFGVNIYDVGDPSDPEQSFSARIEGAFVTSRRIGDQVYVVSRHSPDVVLDPIPSATVDAKTLADLIPHVTINGVRRPLIDTRNCYVTNDSSAPAYPILTTITVFPISNPANFSSVCYNETTVGVYMSETSLYVSEYDWRGNNNGEKTRIHRFALTSGAPVYAGSVAIDGALWAGGQADFRQSEHQGLLRVMVTRHTNDPADQLDHVLYVIRQRTDSLALEVVAQLPNAQRPEEIGKPNEALYGVRFLADRAFAVSYRRIDPLYALDLANPSDPRIAGQLELPGFSDFLHPVTNELLLGIGTTDDSRAKVELFDVSNLAQPASRGNVVLGGPGSSTQARWDRHAFTWAPGATVDRFAIPAVLLTENNWMHLESGLYLFEIHGKQSPHNAELRRAGALLPPLTQAQMWSSDDRSFVHGDSVFYVRDGEVWGAPWPTPSQLRGPF